MEICILRWFHVSLGKVRCYLFCHRIIIVTGDISLLSSIRKPDNFVHERKLKMVMFSMFHNIAVLLAMMWRSNKTNMPRPVSLGCYLNQRFQYYTQRPLFANRAYFSRRQSPE